MTEQTVAKGYKIFHKDWTCLDKQYKVGKTYEETDNPLEMCEYGMHFCKELKDCFRYYEYNPEEIKIAKVESLGKIIDNEDDTKCVTDKLKIIEEIDPNSEFVQLEAVKQNGYTIKYIDNPSEEMKLEAVKQNGNTIKYIDNPSEKVKQEAVKQAGWAIRFIDNPSEQVQLEAVKQDGWSIQHINNPSGEVKVEAVKQDGYAIRFINNLSEKVQLEAVKQNGYAIKYISNPTDKAKLIACQAGIKEKQQELQELLDMENNLKEKIKNEEK